MGPLGHPTICHSVIVLQHVRPSVCPSVWRDFRAFAGERVEGMAWNFKCWCILTIFRAEEIMVTVCWFSSVWRHFDLVKQVKFWVSGLMYLDHLQNWLVYGHSQLIFSCDQAALQMVFSVRPSVTPFWLCSHHRIIKKFSGVITNDQSKVHAKGQGQRSRSQRSQPNLTVSGL